MDNRSTNFLNHSKASKLKRFRISRFEKKQLAFFFLNRFISGVSLAIGVNHAIFSEAVHGTKLVALGFRKLMVSTVFLGKSQAFKNCIAPGIFFVFFCNTPPSPELYRMLIDLKFLDFTSCLILNGIVYNPSHIALLSNHGVNAPLNLLNILIPCTLYDISFMYASMIRALAYLLFKPLFTAIYVGVES